MAQTRFTFHQCSPEKREKLDQKLSEIYDNIKSRFKFFGTFQDVLTKASGYSSADLKDEQEPEEFVKRQLIEPLIDMMGYEIVSATVLSSPVGRKKPDYIIRPKDQDEPIFYVEAEPFNTDLYSENHGIRQVEQWLAIKGRRDYGIATDGFEWILVKYDIASARGKPIFKINLKPIFLRILNPASFVDKKEVGKIEEEFLRFDKVVHHAMHQARLNSKSLSQEGEACTKISLSPWHSKRTSERLPKLSKDAHKYSVKSLFLKRAS